MCNIILPRYISCIIEADLDAMYAKGDEVFAEKDADAIAQGYTEDCQVLMNGRDIIIGRERTSSLF